MPRGLADRGFDPTSVRPSLRLHKLHGENVWSIPQDQEQALELVALFLGSAEAGNSASEQLWRQAIAGGQRSVKLRRVK